VLEAQEFFNRSETVLRTAQLVVKMVLASEKVIRDADVCTHCQYCMDTIINCDFALLLYDNRLILVVLLMDCVCLVYLQTTVAKKLKQKFINMNIVNSAYRDFINMGNS